MLSTVKLGSPSVSICEVSASAILVTVILEDVYSCRKLLFFFRFPNIKSRPAAPLTFRCVTGFSGTSLVSLRVPVFRWLVRRGTGILHQGDGMPPRGNIQCSP